MSLRPLVERHPRPRPVAPGDADLDTPVVFYTGTASDDDRREAADAGAQAYLIKPSDVGRLVETVGQLLRMLPGDQP